MKKIFILFTALVLYANNASTMEGITLTDTVLNKENSSLKKIIVAGCTFTKVRFENSSMIETKFENCTFDSATFDRCNLQGVKFIDCVFKQTHFVKCLCYLEVSQQLTALVARPEDITIIPGVDLETWVPTATIIDLTTK
jgi:hypothetical protein